MNTQQLESFLAVAENLSFARAAEVLNITQPAVSRQIRSLEDELETKLFQRTSRSVALTPSGASFYEDAKSFMGSLQTATARIKRHSKSNVQLLCIGFSNDADCELSANLLKKCREQFPELHPSLRIIPHRSILNLFFHGEIDIMFGFKDDVPSRAGIAYRELSRMPVCCILPSDHKYAQKTEISDMELRSEGIIICKSFALPSQAVLLQGRMLRHFPLESIYFCDNLEAMLTLVKAGYGFGILPKLNRTDPRIVSVPFASREYISFGFFYRDNSQEPMIKKFLSAAQEQADR